MVIHIYEKLILIFTYFNKFYRISSFLIFLQNKKKNPAPSTDLNCTIEKDGSEGFINATDVPTEIKETVIRNKIPLDCMWRIQVQEKWKVSSFLLIFYFPFFFSPKHKPKIYKSRTCFPVTQNYIYY